jgi:hypothetical protein
LKSFWGRKTDSVLGHVVTDYEQSGRYRIAPDRSPHDWPEGVLPMSSLGPCLSGIHQASRKLYLHGKEIVVRCVFRRAAFELVTGVCALVIAAGGLVVNIGRAASYRSQVQSDKSQSSLPTPEFITLSARILPTNQGVPTTTATRYPRIYTVYR